MTFYQWIIWKIGKRSKKIRLWYWKHHGSRYLWGIFRYIHDHDGDWPDK